MLTAVDTLDTIVKHAMELQQQTPASFTEEQKDELIKRALASPDGKIALGEAMANPIHRNLDSADIGGRVLVVDPLPQGSLPEYDRDIEQPINVLCDKDIPG